jgi:outer membrane protein OmpA-like peptidoglycan-associated protein
MNPNPLPTCSRAPLTRIVWLTAATAVLAAATLGVAEAKTVRYYAAGQAPDPSVVAGILGKPTPRLKMRGGATLDEPAAIEPADGGRNVSGEDITARERLLSASAQDAVQAWQARPAQRPVAASAERPTALALAVSFDNGSARLQDDAARALAAVAEGMRLTGFARPFVIEGHSSASGSLAYNLRLSRERARSVKRYLVQQHGIPPAALRTVGLGPTAPLVASDPNAPENRRVQFRAA